MEADFSLLGRSCCGVLGLRGHLEGLAMLGCSSVGVQHPLRAVAAIWVTENSGGFSLGQPNSEGETENIGRFFTAQPSLL